MNQVAGILHLGQIEFTFTTALEGQVAQVMDKFVSVGDKTETELAAAARLCSFSAEELNRCLTKRTVLLNKESFLKSLTPEQALDPGLQAEMDRGHGVLLRQALAHLGHSV